jgi:hypothetical protein
MATYNKKGHIHGKFDQTRWNTYDGIGRNNAKEFWEQKGWDIGDYDKSEDGDLRYDHTDLRATKGKSELYVEAAVKRSDLWKYAKEGVDIETRKLKYVKEGNKAVVNMSDESGDQMMVIPMECLKAAQDSCGDEFKGQGGVLTSDGFEMPDHGCHRVRKRCRKGVGQTGEPEDFYRIPYEYVAHYRKIGGKYEMIHKPTKKV